MKTKYLITALSITALALTGCSAGTQDAGKTMQPLYSVSDEYDADMPPMDDDFDPAVDDFNPMDGMGVMEAGEYEVYPELGGHAKFELPTSPDREEVAAFEEYRQANNFDPLTYLVVDVDNRNGSEILKFLEVTVFDEQGTAYEFEQLEEVVGEWCPDRSWDMDDEVFWAPDGSTISFEEYQEFEAQCNGLADDLVSSVDVAEHNSIILAYEGDDLPDEFTRVSANTYGLGYEQDAFPTDF